MGLFCLYLVYRLSVRRKKKLSKSSPQPIQSNSANSEGPLDPQHERDQLGIQHDRLTYKFRGLDFKLTGVEHARVVNEILA